MALNRFPARIVSRTDGGNAVRSVAYVGGLKLIDERTGSAYDFRRKNSRVEFFGIFAPKDAPEWMKDPGQLANAIERREDKSTRPDQAQLFREFIPTFPHELNADQRRQYVTDFGRELQRKGMLAVIANHKPDPHSDKRNYHPHILVAMREVTPEGFGKKVREWNAPAQLEKMKERWSELGARYLEKAGYPVEAARFRVDHLAREEKIKQAEQRGDTEYAEWLRNNEPNVHLGPAAAAKMRRDEITPTLGNAYRDIINANEENALKRELEKIDGLIAARQARPETPTDDKARANREIAAKLYGQQGKERQPVDVEAMREKLAAFGLDDGKPGTPEKWEQLGGKVEAGKITEKDRFREMAIYLWQEADKERRAEKQQEQERARDPDLER